MTAFPRSLAPALEALGVMVAIFAPAKPVPLAVGLATNEGDLVDDNAAHLISFVGGALLWRTTRAFRRERCPRDGFLLATLLSTLLPGFAALPRHLPLPGLSFTDAGVEVMSGLTATGATVIACIDRIGPFPNLVGSAATDTTLNDFENRACPSTLKIGRLELMSVLVLFTPALWRR